MIVCGRNSDLELKCCHAENICAGTTSGCRYTRIDVMSQGWVNFLVERLYLKFVILKSNNRLLSTRYTKVKAFSEGLKVLPRQTLMYAKTRILLKANKKRRRRRNKY